MLTPTLETRRIILRPLQISDAQAAYNNWTSDPEVAKYMRWSAHKSIDVTIEWLSLEQKNLSDKNIYGWGLVLKESGELFGSGGIFYNKEQEMFEPGYCLMKKCWGMGLATEAARAMIDFAIQQLGVTSVFVLHAKENLASGRVIEKLGFTRIGEGSYKSFDGLREFESWEYILRINCTHT